MSYVRIRPALVFFIRKGIFPFQKLSLCLFFFRMLFFWFGCLVPDDCCAVSIFLVTERVSVFVNYSCYLFRPLLYNQPTPSSKPQGDSSHAEDNQPKLFLTPVQSSPQPKKSSTDTSTPMLYDNSTPIIRLAGLSTLHVLLISEVYGNDS